MKRMMLKTLWLLCLATACPGLACAEPLLAAHTEVSAASPSVARAQAVASAPDADIRPDGALDRSQPEGGTPLVVAPLRTIVIDPGHGGSNEGAIGVSGIHEKHLTLKMALILSDRLKKAFPDANIILTRETDRFISLADRIAIANDAGADLFLSIHFNSSLNPLAVGFESFYAGEFLEQESDKLDDSDEIRERKRSMQPYSQYMAECFNSAMARRFDVLDRGVKPGDYTVLTRAVVPAVVLEFAFLSHALEGMDVIRPSHQSEMIDALVSAVRKYSKGKP